MVRACTITISQSLWSELANRICSELHKLKYIPVDLIVKIPYSALSSLTQSHGTLFDLSRIRTELTDCNVCHDWLWRQTSRWSHWFPSNIGVRAWVSCTHRHVSRRLSLFTASVEQTLSALKPIQTYARNTTDTLWRCGKKRKLRDWREEGNQLSGSEETSI
jgi:hypothetical protein